MEKKLDAKGRHRNHTVAFRMSEEESLLLDLRVALSGLTKQDYITCKLLDKDVIVQGNPRVYKALKKQMEEILQELKRLKTAGEADEEFLQVISLVAGTLKGLKEDFQTMTPTGSFTEKDTERENASAGNRDISEND